jgi:hypothetical protein
MTRLADDNQDNEMQQRGSEGRGGSSDDSEAQALLRGRVMSGLGELSAELISMRGVSAPGGRVECHDEEGSGGERQQRETMCLVFGREDTGFSTVCPRTVHQLPSICRMCRLCA